ncbi:hypothetical protein COB21_00255 [Candidatus Aerophobetes bacterium]|uniref:Uncharacterized protein n=1 Tax=Aerophobetes bacterium TaxID=2030807 RepID=A0A2A4X9C6_UNCAE|nr:MAG: hypothetical protein COB21_00255 [Candidatus Aerophobetes bacterium]
MSARVSSASATNNIALAAAAAAVSAPEVQPATLLMATVAKLNKLTDPRLTLSVGSDGELVFQFAPTPEQRLQQDPDYTHRMTIRDIIGEIDVLEQGSSKSLLQEQHKTASPYSDAEKQKRLREIKKEVANLCYKIHITNLSILDSRAEGLAYKFINNKRKYNERLNMAEEECAMVYSTPTQSQVDSDFKSNKMQIWHKKRQLRRVLNAWLKLIEQHLHCKQQLERLEGEKTALSSETLTKSKSLQRIHSAIVELHLQLRQCYGAGDSERVKHRGINHITSLKQRKYLILAHLLPKDLQEYRERIDFILENQNLIQETKPEPASEATSTQPK